MGCSLGQAPSPASGRPAPGPGTLFRDTSSGVAPDRSPPIGNRSSATGGRRKGRLAPGACTSAAFRPRIPAHLPAPLMWDPGVAVQAPLGFLGILPRTGALHRAGLVAGPQRRHHVGVVAGWAAGQVPPRQLGRPRAAIVGDERDPPAVVLL